MKVFRAIGAFFARIGRWIRDTAWVQPLLIVGGIFAIIFSIPGITKWVQSWFEEGDAAEAYYKKHQISLKNSKDGESEVNELFDYLIEVENFKGELKDFNSPSRKKFGDKFFLSFVQVGCDGCRSGYDGFKTLEKNWNKLGYDIEDNNQFKLHSVYIDEMDKNDKTAKNLFDDHILTTYSYIFEEAIETAQNSYYCANQAKNENVATDKSTYHSIADKMLQEGGFQTPTTFVFDLAEAKAGTGSSYGIVDILFDFKGEKGDDDFAKAKTLCDAWNHAGIFSEDYNK